jgi:hypothetical protein
MFKRGFNLEVEMDVLIAGIKQQAAEFDDDK